MTARRFLLAALALLFVGGCETNEWFFRYETLTGPRVSIEPGTQVEIPFLLDAPGRNEAELRATIKTVSHGSEPQVVEVRLVVSAGEVVADPSDTASVRCLGNCRGEHLLVLSLPAEASDSATVEWTVTAGVSTDGRWRSDQLILTSDELPIPDVWSILPNFEKTRLGPPIGHPSEAGVARLHLTGPPASEGVLRLELPAAGPDQTSGRYVVVVNEVAHQPTLGTSLPLTPPESCTEYLCDWSVVVASLVPWQVASTSAAFDASVTPLERGELTGNSEWRETIDAGEQKQLTVVVTGPSLPLVAGMRLEVNPILWSVSSSESDRQPVLITVGTQQYRLDNRQAATAPTVLVPLECNIQGCQATVPILIDTSDRKISTDLDLRVRATMAGPPPIEGEIRIEVQP